MANVWSAARHSAAAQPRTTRTSARAARPVLDRPAATERQPDWRNSLYHIAKQQPRRRVGRDPDTRIGAAHDDGRHGPPPGTRSAAVASAKVSPTTWWRRATP